MQQPTLWALLFCTVAAVAALAQEPRTAPVPAAGVQLLPVPDVRQSTVYSCGASAIQAVLMYYGEELREDELMRRMATDYDNGTTPGAMAALAKELGYQVELLEDLTLADLEKAVAKGIPVIVAAQAWRETTEPGWKDRWDDGHYLVVIGLDHDNIYFEDPSILGSRGVIPRPEFQQRWHDVEGDGRRYQGLGLLIFGKPPRPAPGFLFVD
jgi:predicted double-glycine peptidase